MFKSTSVSSLRHTLCLKRMRSCVAQVPRSERVLVEAVQCAWQRSPAFLSQTHRISSAQPHAMWWSGQSADTAGSQLCPARSAVTVIHFFHEQLLTKC